MAAEDGLEQLRAPRTDEPENAEHFAGPNVEVDRADARGDQAAHRHRRSPRRHLRRRAIAHDALARDRADEIVSTEIGDLAGQHDLSTTQDRHPISEGEDLGQAMRDVEQRQLLLLELDELTAERFGLLLGQSRGRLVEDEHLWLGAQRLGDLDGLEPGIAERRESGRRLDVRAELFQPRLRFAPLRAFANEGTDAQLLA